MIPNIGHAVLSLNPEAQFILHNNAQSYEDIEWISEEGKPAKTDIAKKFKEIKDNWESTPWSK